MDDKLMVLMGAAAAVTVAGRGLRPVAKLAMKGVVAATDATADARRGITELYNEAKSERHGGGTQPASPPADRTASGAVAPDPTG